MIAIVLGILKIVGILLLIILGILLFFVFSVLFVPVRYRAEGSLYERLGGSASASWFLHLISIKASTNEEKKLDVRILWFHPGRGVRDEDFEERPQETREEEKMPTEGAVLPDAECHLAKQNTEESEKTAKSSKSSEKNLGKAADEPNTDAAKEIVKKKQRMGSALQACKEKLCKLPGALKSRLKIAVKRLRKGKIKWDTFLAFLQNEENQKTFRLLKKQIFALLRHILPRKAKGKLQFGLGDPYLTGQVLTWISPFYGLYGRNIQIIPDFTEVSLEGELKLKGHIRLATLLILFFPMVRDKRVRRWIRAVRKHRHE